MEELLVPHDDPAHVDGDEAVAPERLGEPVGEEHDAHAQDRIEPLVFQAQAVEGEGGHEAHGEAHQAPARHVDEQSRQKLRPRADRVHDRADERRREKHRHRVVAPGLEFEEGLEVPFQTHAAGPHQGEDGGGIRGGDDGPEEHPLLQRQIQQQPRKQADEGRRDGDTQRGERQPPPEHGAHGPPVRVQPPGEEDIGEGEHPHEVGHGGVVEVDAADPLGAGQHPDREKHQEGGHAETLGEPVGEDAQEEEHPRDEDDLRRRGERLGHVESPWRSPHSARPPSGAGRFRKRFRSARAAR